MEECISLREIEANINLLVQLLVQMKSRLCFVVTKSHKIVGWDSKEDKGQFSRVHDGTRQTPRHVRRVLKMISKIYFVF